MDKNVYTFIILLFYLFTYLSVINEELIHLHLNYYQYYQ